MDGDVIVREMIVSIAASARSFSSLGASLIASLRSHAMYSLQIYKLPSHPGISFDFLGIALNAGELRSAGIFLPRVA